MAEKKTVTNPPEKPPETGEPPKKTKTNLFKRAPKTEEVDFRKLWLDAVKSQFANPNPEIASFARGTRAGRRMAAKIARAMHRQWKKEQRAVNFDPMRGRIGKSAFGGRIVPGSINYDPKLHEAVLKGQVSAEDAVRPKGWDKKSVGLLDVFNEWRRNTTPGQRKEVLDAAEYRAEQQRKNRQYRENLVKVQTAMPSDPSNDAGGGLRTEGAKSFDLARGDAMPQKTSPKDESALTEDVASRPSQDLDAGGGGAGSDALPTQPWESTVASAGASDDDIVKFLDQSDDDIVKFLDQSGNNGDYKEIVRENRNRESAQTADRGGSASPFMRPRGWLDAALRGDVLGGRARRSAAKRSAPRGVKRVVLRRAK